MRYNDLNYVRVTMSLVSVRACVYAVRQAESTFHDYVPFLVIGIILAVVAVICLIALVVSRLVLLFSCTFTTINCGSQRNLMAPTIVRTEPCSSEMLRPRRDGRRRRRAKGDTEVTMGAWHLAPMPCRRHLTSCH